MAYHQCLPARSTEVVRTFGLMQGLWKGQAFRDRNADPSEKANAQRTRNDFRCLGAKGKLPKTISHSLVHLFYQQAVNHYPCVHRLVPDAGGGSLSVSLIPNSCCFLLFLFCGRMDSVLEAFFIQLKGLTCLLLNQPAGVGPSNREKPFLR